MTWLGHGIGLPALGSGGRVTLPDYFGAFDDAVNVNVDAVPVTVLSKVIPAASLLPNTTYLVHWSAAITPATSTGFPRAEVRVNGAAVGRSTIMRQGTTPNDINAHTGFAVFTTGAVPVETTVALVADCVTTGTMNVGDKSLFILRLGAADFVADNGFDVEHSTAAITLQTALTLNFTPPIPGDYLLLYNFDAIQTTSVAQYWQVTSGPVTVGEYLIGNNNVSGNDRVSICGAIPRAALSGAQSITISHRTGNATYPSAVRSLRLIAVSLTRFARAFTAWQAAAASGTDIAYTDTLALTATLNAGAHWWLATAPMMTSAAAISSYHQLLKDGVSEVEFIREPSATSARASVLAAGRLETFGAGSHTLKWQRKSETISQTTSTGAGAALALLDLAGLRAG